MRSWSRGRGAPLASFLEVLVRSAARRVSDGLGTVMTQGMRERVWYSQKKVLRGRGVLCRAACAVGACIYGPGGGETRRLIEPPESVRDARHVRGVA